MALGPSNLGPFPVRWYALGYIFGLLLGWWYAVRDRLDARACGARRGKGPLSEADIDDFAFYAMIGILLGGRIGYILFYTIPYEPEKLFGPTATSLHLPHVGRRHVLPWRPDRRGPRRVLTRHGSARFRCSASATSRAPPRPIGIFLVRIANFINGELYGRPTDAPWAMRFPDYNWATREWGPVDGKPLVHPSQLYEARSKASLLFAVCAVASGSSACCASRAWSPASS